MFLYPNRRGFADPSKLHRHTSTREFREVEQLQQPAMINPTYLAQRTRACKFSFCSIGSHCSTNTTYSRQLGRCEDPRAQVLQGLDTGSKYSDNFQG